MRFQVPQFIDIEDKVFGPLSLKQFLYLAGGAGLAFIFYRLLPLLIALIPMAAVIGLALALAFIKVHNRPFVEVMYSYFKFIFSKKTYIWDRSKKPKRSPEAKSKTPEKTSEKLNQSRLKNMAWALDVLDQKEQTGK